MAAAAASVDIAGKRKAPEPTQISIDTNAFVCMICLLIPPVRILATPCCGQIVCEGCHKKLVEQKTTQCPACRKRIRTEDYRENQGITRLFDALSFPPCEKCGKHLDRKTVCTHKNVCPKRLVSCKRCSYKGVAEGHLLKECLEKTILKIQMIFQIIQKQVAKMDQERFDKQLFVMIYAVRLYAKRILGMKDNPQLVNPEQFEKRYVEEIGQIMQELDLLIRLVMLKKIEDHESVVNVFRMYDTLERTLHRTYFSNKHVVIFNKKFEATVHPIPNVENMLVSDLLVSLRIDPKNITDANAHLVEKDRKPESCLLQTHVSLLSAIFVTL